MEHVSQESPKNRNYTIFPQQRLVARKEEFYLQRCSKAASRARQWVHLSWFPGLGHPKEQRGYQSFLHGRAQTEEGSAVRKFPC